MQNQAASRHPIIDTDLTYEVTGAIKHYTHSGAAYTSIGIVIHGDPPVESSVDVRLVFDRPNWVVRLDYEASRANPVFQGRDSGSTYFDRKVSQDIEISCTRFVHALFSSHEDHPGL